MASTLTNLLYHIVFSTKHRIPLITEDIQEPLYRYVGGIIRGEGGSQLEIGGTPDHVHILARFPARKSVSDMLRHIKASSSKWLNDKGREDRFAWQEGYGAFSVSQSRVPAVRRYLENQEEHHRRWSFKQELISLLEKHGVEYDERYLWN